MDNISQIISRSIGGYSIGSILSALLTFLICLIVVRLVMKLCARLLSRASRLNERLQKVILTSLKTLLYLLSIIITAEALGINTSSLTAIMSVLTLGITLAAEDILGNVAGGLVIRKLLHAALFTVKVRGVKVRRGRCAQKAAQRQRRPLRGAVFGGRLGKRLLVGHIDDFNFHWASPAPRARSGDHRSSPRRAWQRCRAAPRTS